MKKINYLVIAVLILSLAVGFNIGGCGGGNTDKLSVVTSTSLMQYITEQVGGNLIQVTNLVPPNQHPGNFDIKPSDVQNLAKAKLLLLHGWPGEGYVDKLVASANNPNLVVIKASVNGNWMIPSNQAAAADKVAEALTQVDGKNAATYQKNADAFKKRIQNVETEIKSILNEAEVSAIKVIASARQADFLQWAGFQVEDSFQSPQELTPQRIQELIDKGRTNGVTLVINNLQDGKDAGQAIAQELGIKNLNLSNFPGGFDDTATWEKAIRYNVDILIKSIGG